MSEPLGQYPGQGQLRRCASLLAGNLFDPPEEVQILLKVFPLKTRRVPAIIVRREIVKLLKLSGQKPAPQRAVRDKSNAQLSARRQNRGLGSRVHKEYSVCNAAIGCTFTARRSVGTEAS